MVGINVTVKGGSEIKSKFNKSSEIIDDAFSKVLTKIGYDIVGYAKPIVPYKVGDLSRSLSVSEPRKVNGKTEVSVGSNLPYAAYQEFGQRKDGSHKVVNYSKPGTGKEFLKKGFENARNKMNTDLRNTLGEIEFKLRT